MKKLSLEQLLNYMDEQKAQICNNFLKENIDKIKLLPGSVQKHQAWEGGYIDHIVEVMNIADMLYDVMNKRRKLPFAFGDALFVLFFHDFDKLERYVLKDGVVQAEEYNTSVNRIKEVLEMRWSYTITQEEYNAFKYTHGENSDYSESRLMGELATFVHCCDTISARIWYNYGKNRDDWA